MVRQTLQACLPGLRAKGWIHTVGEGNCAPQYPTPGGQASRPGIPGGNPMSHLQIIISGISWQAALDPPCLHAENTLVFGSSSRRMDSLPGMAARDAAQGRTNPKADGRNPKGWGEGKPGGSIKMRSTGLPGHGCHRQYGPTGLWLRHDQQTRKPWR